MKKIIFSVIFLMLWSWVSAENEEELNNKNNINTQCYKSFYEIQTTNIEKNKNNELKIILENKNDIILTQSWELLPYLTIAEKLKKIEYKNEYWIKELSPNDFNQNTYKEMDTLESKSIVFELEKKLKEWNFVFNFDFEAKNYDLLIYISKDWKNFDLVEQNDIQNHSFKYVKLETICKNFWCGREKIKINELNFRENTKTIITKIQNKKDIKIYTDNNCESINFINNNPENLNFVNNNEVPTIEINLEKNPDYSSSLKIDNKQNNEENTEISWEKIDENLTQEENTLSEAKENNTNTGNTTNSGNISNSWNILGNNDLYENPNKQILELEDNEIIRENAWLRIVVILSIIFMFIFYAYYLIKNFKNN